MAVFRVEAHAIAADRNLSVVLPTSHGMQPGTSADTHARDTASFTWPDNAAPVGRVTYVGTRYHAVTPQTDATAGTDTEQDFDELGAAVDWLISKA